jgi:Family of unknown function (DUF5996)
MTSETDVLWPEFPSKGWAATYETLHMWLQIVGKTRLALAPMENHWWQVALYVTSRGLSTSPMPTTSGSLTVELDFQAHALLMQSSEGSNWSMPLRPMSVSEFYRLYLEGLSRFGVTPAIYPRPVEIPVAIPFADDLEHAAYQPQAVHACWQILLRTERVLKRWRGLYLGKQSPVHFFWGSFDLAATRFSGRPAPRHPGGAPNCPDRVMVEAYSHECSSCGFWPGDGKQARPAFYAYAYPEPPGYSAQSVGPPGAAYDHSAREFLLAYSELRALEQPDDALLEFFRGTYVAAATQGAWNRTALERG